MQSQDIAQDAADCKPLHKKSTPRPDPWYKRYPEDYRRGTRRLSLAARGAYSDIIDLIFTEGGPIPDDNRWIACALHVTPRQWLKVRKELFAARKLLLRDGGISNARADEELAQRSATKSRPNQNQNATRLGPGSRPKVGPPNGTLPNEINGGKHTEAEAEPDSELDGVNGEVESSSSSVVSLAKAAAAKLDLDILMQKLVDAAGEPLAHPAMAPGLLSLSIPLWWVEQGCDVERDILPALRKIAGRKRQGRKILSWEYYNNLVAENRDARMQGLKAKHDPAEARSKQPAYYDPDVARAYAEAQAALMQRPMVTVSRGEAA